MWHRKRLEPMSDDIAFRPLTRLGRKIAGVALAILLAVVASPERGNAASASATDTVHSFYQTLLSTMQNGAALGQSGRYRTLEPAVDRAFDLSYMTRTAVGPAWSTLSAGQQQEVTDAFGRYITATYADRFDRYSGEKLLVTGEQRFDNGALVHSRIVKSNGEPIAINYLMRQSGDVWQIADIYLTGTISELATRRSEFSSILRREGIEGLISMLNQKAEMLVRSAAKS